MQIVQNWFTASVNFCEDRIDYSGETESDFDVLFNLIYSIDYNDMIGYHFISSVNGRQLDS